MPSPEEVADLVVDRIAALGPARNRSRQWVLRLPARWPQATAFNTALGRIRSLPLLT